MSSFAHKATDVLQVNSRDLRDRRDLADDMELSRGASFNAEWFDSDPISESVNEYEQHVRLGSKDAAVHFDYGKRFLELGRGLEKRAVEAFSLAASLEPENADVRYHLGLAYAVCRKFRQATEAYKTALELQPRNQDVLMALFHMHISTGSLPEAVQCLRSLHNIAPSATNADALVVSLLLNSFQLFEDNTEAVCASAGATGL